MRRTDDQISDDEAARFAQVLTQFGTCLGELVRRDPQLLHRFYDGTSSLLLDRYGLDDLTRDP